ncbi:MAG: pseudouridine synthase [Chitinophagales bacterium]|nr:pseudouridine synthase [Chitinophagales bacterium]
MKKEKNSFNYYKVFKPFGMLSQFTVEGNHQSLASLKKFPEDVYPVGRLDHDTEGLLLLTNNTSVNHLLLDPKFERKKTYWVQIEGEMNEDAMQQLQKGVVINLKGTMHQTKPTQVKNISSPKIPERNPSVNYLKHPVNSWIELTITEGKNRQVRKMTAKVGHPTLRLIRCAIEAISIEGMKSGEVVEMNEEDFFTLLQLRKESLKK